MATADEYASWIVANVSRRGTPDYNTVVQAYEQAKSDEGRAATPVAPTATDAPGMAQKALGALETATTLGTGAIGGTVGAIGGTALGLAQQILSGNFGTPEAANMVEQAAAKGAEALTYAPRTQAGREMVQATGEVLKEAIPLTGMLPQMAMLQRATQAAAPIAQATAQRAGTAAVQAARTGVVQPVQQAISAVKGVVTPSTPLRPGSAGAAATPAAIQRVATAEGLPVPVTLTRGAAAREAAQLAFEKEQMKAEAGAPLRQRAEENNLQALQNFDALVDATGAVAAEMGPTATGNAVLKSLNEGLDASKTQVRTAYNAARKAPEAANPVNLTETVTIGQGENQIQNSLIGYLNSRVSGIPSSAVPDAAKSYLVKMGLAQLDEEGGLVARPATVGTLEDFRKEMSGLAKYDDAVGIREETIIKKMVDAHTDPASGPMFKKARALRRNQSEKYEDRAIIGNLLLNRAGMADPLVATDKIFQKLIVNGSPADITRLKRTLLTGGRNAPNAAEIRANGAQAWSELQGAAIKYLKDEATKNMGMGSNDMPIVSPAQLHQAVRKLDANGRLDIVLGKKQAQVVRDLNDVVRYVNTVPPGTLINSSGTAGTILAAMGESALAEMFLGVPAPIATGLVQIIKMKKAGQTKAKINDALNALPIVNP